MTTDKQELQRLCDAASPGPWTAYGCCVEGPSLNIYDEGGHTEADAEFIAAARTAIPTLLAELAEREWPVTYRRVTEGRGVRYAVYGTSSNNYADALEKELAAVTAERDGLKVALSRLMDTCEYWIDHGKQPDMSEEDYKLWLATGHQSDAVLAAKELLRKPLPHGKEGRGYDVPCCCRGNNHCLSSQAPLPSTMR